MALAETSIYENSGFPDRERDEHSRKRPRRKYSIVWAKHIANFGRACRQCRPRQIYDNVTRRKFGGTICVRRMEIATVATIRSMSELFRVAAATSLKNVTERR